MQQARSLLRRAVTGQDLRGATECAPKHFVEGDTSKMPAVRLAVDIQRNSADQPSASWFQLSCQIRIASAPCPLSTTAKAADDCPDNVRSFDLCPRQSGTVGHVEVPLKGIQTGERLSWMKNTLGG